MRHATLSLFTNLNTIKLRATANFVTFHYLCITDSLHFIKSALAICASALDWLAAPKTLSPGFHWGFGEI